MDVQLGDLWGRMSRLAGSWQMGLEVHHSQGEGDRPRWRISLLRKDASAPATITVEDEVLVEALLRGVCAAEAQDEALEARRAPAPSLRFPGAVHARARSAGA
ncbi:MAG: hypothetical protein WD749_06335 [Phycisphaerales bacterium]